MTGLVRPLLKLWVILLLWDASSAVAQLAPPSWFARVWRAYDGLPGDNVTGVAQTKDGYLWIATQDGLARFDGVRLQNIPYSARDLSPIIWDMLRDSEQRLWLAEDGGTVVRLADGRPTTFSRTNGFSSTFPMSMAEARGHVVWISYLDGTASRIDGKTVTRFTARDGLTGNGACFVASDSEGQLWFAKNERVGIFRDGQFITQMETKARAKVLPARDGGLWLCSGDQLLKSKSGQAPVALGKISPDSAVTPSAMLEDRTGALWIGTTSKGLFRYDGTNISKIEVSHGRIRSLTEDREGNIWVGTDGGGLNRLRQRVVELQSKETGLPFETVRSICEDATGTWWVATQNGELARNAGNGWETIPDWPGGQATCVVRDPQGVVWIGSYNRGLYHWQGGSFARMTRLNGLAGLGIRSLFVDRDGALWIGFAVGSVVQRWRDGQLQTFPQPPGSRAVRAIAQDTQGVIWMATLDRLLLRVRGDALTDVTAQSIPMPEPIRCLCATPDGSLWIGFGGGGVGRLKDGRFARVSTAQGLYDADICSLMADDYGRMWFTSDHGIFQTSQKQLNEAAERKSARVESIVYDQDEGLPSLQGYYGYAPGAIRCRDGRLLFPTHLGLAIVQPASVRDNRLPPQAVIESVKVDNQKVEVAQGRAALQLPPSHRRLEVAFTAPSFVDAEQIHFRYQLKGWDDDWVEARDQRLAVYSRLPAGSYQFRVIACNSAGVWDQSAAGFDFQVRPFFWRTWWFILALFLIFTGCVVALDRYLSFRRLRWKLRRLQQEAALQKERARIAEDIHDDLGACLTQISLIGELAEHWPQKTGQHIRQVAGLARQGIKSLDEIVWSLNPRNDTLPHLLDYTAHYAVDFLQAADIRCRLDLPAAPPPRDLSAEQRHSLFLAIKEALHNAAKHAQASEVWLRAQATEDGLRVVIEDNGRGIAWVPDDALADGLRNLRQRLAKIGGACIIESQVGAGTKISLEMPWVEK